MTVLRRDLLRCAVRPAEHDRHLDRAAAHLAKLRGVADDLVERDKGEVPRHELDDRTKPGHRRANADASKAGFRDRSIDHALFSEGREQALAHLVGALIVPNLFAHQEDALVSRHLLHHGFAKSFTITKRSHRPPPKCFP